MPSRPICWLRRVAALDLIVECVGCVLRGTRWDTRMGTVNLLYWPKLPRGAAVVTLIVQAMTPVSLQPMAMP